MKTSEHEFFYSQNTDFELIEILVPHLNYKSFIDIGAEKGTFTKLLSHHKLSGVLFEPLPQFAPELNALANETKCTFFPYAIDHIDRVADFYVANDHIGESTGHFSSLHQLKNDQRISHKKICTVTCRSINSLLHDGNLNKKIGIIKIDTEGNDLNVLKGMTEIQPEVLMCEYFMPGIYSGWELGHPKGLIDAAKVLGFEHYIVIKRIDEFELVSVNDTIFIDKQWGNLIFLRKSMFDSIKPLLDKIIAQKATRLFNKSFECTQMLRTTCEELRVACEERLQLISQLNNKKLRFLKKIFTK